MTITDEMVEKAWEAYWQSGADSPRDAMRAALEAVEPMLTANLLNALGEAYEAVARARAQGMREAADKLRGNQLRKHNIEHLRDVILARAQEIDPK